MAVAMAARAAAAADAAGSIIVGIVVLLRVSFFENAEIMMRASRFMVSISIAGNSDTPPLIRPASDETGLTGEEVGLIGVAGLTGGGGATATEGRGIFRDCSRFA